MTQLDRFLDDLGDQLFAEQPSRRRRRSWIPVVAVSMAVAAAFMFGVRDIRSGRDGEREATLSPSAPTQSWTPELGSDERGHPTIDRGSVPHDQLRALAVLRRPQTDADRSAPVQALLKRLDPLTHIGIRVDAIRLLADRDGWATVLVPMRRRQPPNGGQGVVGTREDALCLMQSLPDGTAGETCGTTTDLYSRGIGWPDPPFGLVPDGVAEVELRAQGDESMRVPVTNNVYNLRTGSKGDLTATQPPRLLDERGDEISRR